MQTFGSIYTSLDIHRDIALFYSTLFYIQRIAIIFLLLGLEGKLNL